MPQEFKVKNGLIVDQGGATITGSAIISSSNATQLQVGNNLLFVSSSGNVGIGTNTPLTKLHIIQTSSIGVRESLMKFSVSDAGNDAFYIGNGTSTDNTFWPAFAGYGESTVRSGIQFLGLLPASADASDSSNRGILNFEALRTNNGTDPLNGTFSAIQNRKIFTLCDFTGPFITVYPSRNIAIGSEFIPSSRVHVRGSGTTSATTALRVENTNASASLVVLDNGQVGIGTTTPSASILLDVSGSIRATNIVPVADITHNIGTTTFRYNSVFTRVLSATASTLDLIGYNIRLMDFAGVTRTMLTFNNNFLIGTTTDAGFRLDVSGSTRITNNLTVTGSLIASGPNGGIDTVNSVLTDSTTNRIEWANGVLNSSTGESINWESRILSDPSNTFVALEYSSDAYLNSQLYYRNIIPGQVQRSISDTPTYGGQVIQATVDAGVVDYDLVFLDTDGTWKGVKAAVGYGADKMLGICVDQAGGYVLIEGDVGVSDDASQGAYVVGADHGLPVYASETTGVMITTAPSGVGAVVRIVGHIYYQSATDTNWWVMKFRPSNDWYEQ